MALSLVLTLGHNASAIAVEDGNIIAGYEEERFTGKKSDSSFPIQAITRIRDIAQVEKFDDICIGHWFTAGQLVESKYADFSYLESLVADKADIHSIEDGFTHHDSHMLSAEVFAHHYGIPLQHTAVVADGFGTFGECISIYQVTGSSRRLLNRYFGFDKSLGLLYQYATAFLQMKMHNHEYKMLGYEAHIDSVLGSELKQRLHELIHKEATAWIKNTMNNPISMTHDPLVNTAALAQTQNSINEILMNVLDEIDPDEKLDLYEKRVVISYFVQALVESVMCSIIGLYKPSALVVSGGLFYNVKLNHLLANMVDKFCVMPLAGDQGAGLGVYQNVHGDLTWPGHLFWGIRNLDQSHEGSGLITTNDTDFALEVMHTQLRKRGFVNVVRGAMEFGPRSLCNTATLALPTLESVDVINRMNDRTTIMPMAPVMSAEQANHYLEGCDKIVGSLDYMVVTRNVKVGLEDKMLGASHYYPASNTHTCRPQIISEDDWVSQLTYEFGPLINTSFNYHGVPIVFDKASIEYSHKQQNKVAEIKTVVIY